MAMMSQLVLACLPPGFRFQPTDEQLVVDYLQRRNVGQPCLIPTIVDIDMYYFDPWKLPGMALYGDHEWYFFTKTARGDQTCVRSEWMIPSGSWKPTGTNKTIFVEGMQEVPIAIKRVFVFYLGHPPLETNKTSWIMHEYRLTNPKAMPLVPSSMYPNEEVVLCRISNKDMSKPSLLHRDILQLPPAGLYDAGYNPTLDLEPLALEYPDHVIAIDDAATSDDPGDLDEEDASHNTTSTNMGEF